ncbi:MAG: aminotransferase class III-fold pyridoxal phosphate-dependent enzyme [Candidatus Margulisbacteria bacterium]|jgi:4-aminobutyrate aminotransferase|nr:aminotransferase class III-fold pyridoxal phosphate-dependent enzyme [Candidatus Margulisiibacteriota bacterium]
MNNLKSRGLKVMSPVLGKYFDDFEIKGGQAGYLLGLDGQKYLDFATGIASCPTGHCHPRVAAAIKKQADTLLHTCIGVAYYEGYVSLAEELQKIAPMKKALAFFCQSGSEAVEASLKLAKYATKKPGIIAFQGGFHGRTLGALSVTTSKLKYRDGYEPLLPEVYVAPLDLKVVEGLLKTKKIAGLIIEPILGEGGYVVVKKDFLQGLRRLADRYGALLIFDEVQTGIGRTGKWFACQHTGVVPDIIALAKGIASGLPLGACLAKAEVMQKWSPGAHGSTFGGNPVCCAAAIATLQVIRDEKLLANAVKQGAYLLGELKRLQKKYPAIKDVRGLGLMIGVDFGANEPVRSIMNQCLKQGVLMIPTGADGTVMRLIPPLGVTRAQVDQALRAFSAALANV